MLESDTERQVDVLASLEAIETRLRWLSAWTIHNANHLRESRDGLKVGGHQASCASMTAIMAALYFHVLRPQDRVAVKPHAGPVLHAVHYLLGQQSRERLQQFRALDGAQSYPSRTKDKIPVDFSTGSVGLGVAVTAFASLVQDYLVAHGQLDEAETGRMVALLGDAELDEGNIYEALIECYKHDVRNCWWIVDYNRQSLDATSADRMFSRFDDIFRTCGWRVLTLKYGKLQLEAFARPGGRVLQAWIDNCPNADFAALTYSGGGAWRARLLADVGAEGEFAALIASYDDEALASLMTGLAGHCMSTLLEAFETAGDPTPTLFIVYTIKGFGLPFAGHKDNHAGLMNPAQVETLRTALNIPAGHEWEQYAGLGDNAAARLRAFVGSSPLAPGRTAGSVAAVPVPARLAAPEGREQSTQAAFGRILLDISKSGGPLADRIVTTSPDVTVSTNLGAWVNQRGLFRRQETGSVRSASTVSVRPATCRTCTGPIGSTPMRSSMPAPTCSWRTGGGVRDHDAVPRLSAPERHPDAQGRGSVSGGITKLAAERAHGGYVLGDHQAETAPCHAEDDTSSGDGRLVQDPDWRRGDVFRSTQRLDDQRRREPQDRVPRRPRIGRRREAVLPYRHASQRVRV